MSVQSGITDLSEIRQLYNSSQKGDGGLLNNIGNAITNSARWVDRNIITPTSNVLSAVSDPKGAAYAIMANDSKEEDRPGWDRNMQEIIGAVYNKEAIVANRGNIDRNLASLYIYGNDLGQFREAPELISYGVNYDNYLRSIGRDPSKVKTYEGKFSLPPIIFPQEAQDRLKSYILSRDNKTFGDYQPLNESVDNVAGFLRRFDLNDKGEPIMVNSDIWDFEPNSYSANYGSWIQAKLLDLVGTPFILKQTQPIEYIDSDRFYNNYDYYTQEWPEVYRGMGYLPEFTFTSTRPTKKALGGTLKKNKFEDGGRFISTGNEVLDIGMSFIPPTNRRK